MAKFNLNDIYFLVITEGDVEAGFNLEDLAKDYAQEAIDSDGYAKVEVYSVEHDSIIWSKTL